MYSRMKCFITVGLIPSYLMIRSWVEQLICSLFLCQFNDESRSKVSRILLSNKFDYACDASAVLDKTGTDLQVCALRCHLSIDLAVVQTWISLPHDENVIA